MGSEELAGSPDESSSTNASGAGGLWFVGDLDDPWVRRLLQRLEREGVVVARRVACPGPLRDPCFEPRGPLPDTLVLHRSTLTRADTEALARLRSLQNPPCRIWLCVGPHVRHADLERAGAVVDGIVDEGTADVTLVRRLAPSTGDPASSARRPRVVVAGSNPALRSLVVETLDAAGYPSQEVRELAEAPAGPVVWDAPVLERGWSDALATRADRRLGPVIALLGLADRALVAEALEQGASACLDLPFDLDDLTATLERVIASAGDLRVEPGHVTPPVPAVLRQKSRESV